MSTDLSFLEYVQTLKYDASACAKKRMEQELLLLNNDVKVIYEKLAFIYANKSSASGRFVVVNENCRDTWYDRASVEYIIKALTEKTQGHIDFAFESIQKENWGLPSEEREVPTLYNVYHIHYSFNTTTEHV